MSHKYVWKCTNIHKVCCRPVTLYLLSNFQQLMNSLKTKLIYRNSDAMRIEIVKVFSLKIKKVWKSLSKLNQNFEVLPNCETHAANEANPSKQRKILISYFVRLDSNQWWLVSSFSYFWLSLALNVHFTCTKEFPNYS